MADDAEPSAYERGQQQGKTDARLTVAEEHLDRINGSIADTGQALTALAATVAAQGSVLAATFTAQIAGLTLQMQRLADQQTAAAATAELVASTLKDADTTRLQQAEQKLSPRMRLLTVVGTVVAVVAAIVGIVIGLRG
jgi:hypothetical protein